MFAHRSRWLFLIFSPLAVAALAAVKVEAAPIVYEGFNYSAGAIDGTQNGGTGMTGAWATSVFGSGTPIPYSMVSGGLTFTDLSTVGSVRAKRATAPGGAQLNRQISGASQTALTADNSSIWFSVLVFTERFSAGNENGTFALASAPFSNSGADGGVLPTITGGEGFGLTIFGNTPGNPFQIFAFSTKNGTSERSGGEFLDTGTTPDTFLIMGNMEWVPNGGNDTLTLYNVTDLNAPLPTPFATINADLDQTQFNTLAIANQQVSSLDEIRFGLTANDVGLVFVPEPSMFVLASLGLLGLIGIRRRAKRAAVA